MDEGPCLRASGTSLVNWLQSSPLPRADENLLYSPWVLGTSGPLIMHTYVCFAYGPSRDYQTPELWLVPDARSQVPPPPLQAEEAVRVGRSRRFTDSFSSGFPASLACQTSFWTARLHLLWVRSVEERNLISYQAVTDELFGSMWPSAEAWASHHVLCLHCWMWAPGCCPPRSPRGQTGPVYALGARAPARGVSCVPRSLDVWLNIWSSSDRRCDKLGSLGHSCAHRQLKRVFVSQSLTSSGQEPGSKKGEKAKQPSHSWLNGPGTQEQEIPARINTCHPPSKQIPLWNTFLLSRARNCFLSLKKTYCIIYCCCC